MIVVPYNTFTEYTLMSTGNSGRIGHDTATSTRSKRERERERERERKRERKRVRERKKERERERVYWTQYGVNTGRGLDRVNSAGTT